jgi:ABC-type sugar transport system ATPase subunit
MEGPILTFDNVAKSYGDVRALRSLSFAVERRRAM